MVIVFRSIEDLIPYARNARTHSDAQVAQIAGSMREFGWTNPVLIDEAGGIIAGHGRVLAARKLDLTSDVPCIVLEGLSEAQKRALVIADNKLAQNAGWNIEMLAMELGDISSDGFDLSVIGFTAGEIDALLSGPGPTVGDDGEEVPTAPTLPVTEPGDVWICGRHRLMCGNSGTIEDVEKLMDGCEADLCFTSPPYLQQRGYKAEITDWDRLMQDVFSILPMAEGAQVLVNLGIVHKDVEWVEYWSDWIKWMGDAGWRRFGWYVWDQGSGMQGDFRGRLPPSFEFIFHFNRAEGGKVTARKTVPKKDENVRDKSFLPVKTKNTSALTTVNYSPTAALSTHKVMDSVIRVGRHRGGIGESGAHPAIFPVDLVSQMLCTFSAPDHNVYEPFCGSGTSLIAAQKNGRNCHAMEVAPEYVDVSLRRWSKFAAQHPILDGDGRTFEEVAASRGKPSR